MTLASDFVLWELLLLEEQVKAFRRHARTLAATFGTGPVVLAIEAMTGVRGVLDRLAATVGRLRAHVVAYDGQLMGNEVESMGELWLRAAMMVVAEQLSKIGAESRSGPRHGHPSGTTRSPALFVGKFRTFDDLVSFVLEELSRIHGSWMCYSPRYGRCSGTVEQSHERRFLYRRAVADAQRALATLREDPEVAHFLYVGRESTDWPELRMACNQILTALGISLDVELDPSLLQGPLAHAPAHSLVASSRRRR
jgi:hypothetical protein